jgi:B9 domain-containing protein 1
MPSVPSLYVKHTVVYGSAWNILSGAPNGISQLSLARKDGFAAVPHFVFNLPVDISFRSSNPHGWPQIVVGVYGLDWRGRDVARGFGSAHIPLAPGRHALTLPLFQPRSATFLEGLVGVAIGSRPEYRDLAFVASGRDRDATFTTSCGEISLVLDVIMQPAPVSAA